MSSSCSESDSSVETAYEDNSDFEYEFEEMQSVGAGKEQALTADDDVDEGAYQDEPIASEEWVDEYDKKQKTIKDLEIELQKRLSGELSVGDWCKCGNCDNQTLQNISECYCCTELDGCMESLDSDLVRQETPQDVKLSCVTQHPGFYPVCLQKWSLRMAADRFRTKSKQRYRQTGRFLRSISYREFSRLIYGMLGSKRIPLPACAYQAIRNAFPLTADERHTGFDLNETDEL